MPYIPENEKRVVNRIGPSTPGQLNYALTRVGVDYLRAISLGTPSYADMTEVLAAFEAAKLEFYRRVMAPYEDQKIAENGDVYDA